MRRSYAIAAVLTVEENRQMRTSTIELSRREQVSPRCDAMWVLLTDALGDNDQCLALAELLDIPFTTIPLDWKALDAQQDRSISKELLADTPDAEQRRHALGLQHPWPRVVIGSGRRSNRIGLWIKAQSAGRTKYIAIGRARAGIDQYDLLVAPPQFSLPNRPNVVCLRLPLARGSSSPAQRFPLPRRHGGAMADLVPVPRPWFTILIGGEVKEFVTSEHELVKAAQCARAAARAHGGSVVVSGSRRTPSTVLAAVEAALGQDAYIYRWSRSNPSHNPYRALIAQSSALFVTADSASMIADACRSGTPTYIIEYPERYDVRRRWRRRLFHAIRSAIALCGTYECPDAGRFLDLAQEWLHNNKILRYPRDLRKLHASVYAMGLAQPMVAFRPDNLPSRRMNACDPLSSDTQALIRRCRSLI